MDLIKTVKRWVSGSEKIFDIYECTVDEVEAYTSDTGKSMVKVKINGEEYNGLHNKWVYDFLCENEGQESFVVMWRAPKGKPMVAYVKDIWKDHLEGKETGVVPKETEAYDDSNHDSFVYLWINKSTDKKYIGKHKGTTDDGYVASSELFLADYNECPDNFKRTILAYGSDTRIS